MVHTAPTPNQASDAQAGHTPGPWEVRFSRWHDDLPACGFAVYGPIKEKLIWDASRSIPNTDRKECSITSANCSEGVAFSAFYAPTEIEANGRLIAAAPTMFAALTKWTAAKRVFGPASEEAEESYGDAMAAIAKALGQ